MRNKKKENEKFARKIFDVVMFHKNRNKTTKKKKKYIHQTHPPSESLKRHLKFRCRFVHTKSEREKFSQCTKQKTVGNRSMLSHYKHTHYIIILITDDYDGDDGGDDDDCSIFTTDIIYHTILFGFVKKNGDLFLVR